MIRTVVIIGSGNVADALARRLAASGLLLQVWARRAARARAVAEPLGVAWTDRPGQLLRADCYVIAVSDGAVAEVAASLPIPDDALVAHTAGSVPLGALPARFAQRAVIYPFQTFTLGRAVEWDEVPVFVEADDPAAAERAEALARRIGGAVYRADYPMRRKVHLAGVFACNFVNALYGVGRRIVAGAGLPYAVLFPLIRQTACKALATDDPARVQTGPAVRGDRQVQQSHLELLADDPTLTTLYENLSKTIWEISRKTSPAAGPSSSTSTE